MARIIGERIILREYQKEDLPYIRTWVNDPEITDYLSNVFLYPHTVDGTEKFLNAMLEGNTDMKGFVIAHKDTEEYIGQIDLINIDWVNRIGTIGIVIGSKENLNKGYGTKAIKLLQEFAFNKLNLHKLDLEVRAYNERAINCYKKCGFIEEGRIRENFYVNGKYTDTLFMGILKREWIA
ncbi:MAG: GNAT family N-acetyltransferase [Tissierellia bacterium]|nr:GNAT family N-acetyltransferase [Tissierellia bacterium]